MDRVGKAAVRISRGGNLFIDETPGQSLSEVVAKARALKIRNPSVSIIYVDYLQLIHAEDETRAEELRQISYGLKDLAKQLMIPIVVAAQLNGKAISQRADKRPTPDDVQGSSGLHQAVHYLALLYRPSMYDHVHHDVVELEFAAARSVGVFTAILDAEMQFMRLRSSHNPKPVKAHQEAFDV
jgi:replicative DNA helicase